jgi:replicative DNA helicase
MSAVSMYPNSPDAERGVLCSVLLSPSCLDDLVELSEGSFYHPVHGVVWAALLDLHRANKPIDLVTLTQHLSDTKLLDHVGGPATLAELQTFLPTAANVLEYKEILIEKQAKRDVIMTANDTARMASESNESAVELLNRVEARWMELRVRGQRGKSLRPLKEFVMEAVDSIELAFKNRGQCSGLETGIHKFDRMHGGLKPGDLIIIAGRPSNGKSAFAMQLALHIAKLGNRVAVFSLEMTGKQLAERIVCGEYDLDLQHLRDGFITKEKMRGLASAATMVAKLPIEIDETPALEIHDFRGRARRAVAAGAQLIVVDYLQLFKSDTKRGRENRAHEVAEVSMMLKATAKELNVPVLAAAQLNRNADDRSTPKLSDLRESGQIEQDADVALLLNRPNKDRVDEDGKKNDDGYCELVLAKQRAGPTGTIELTFDGAHTRFINRDKKMYSTNPAEREGGAR